MSESTARLDEFNKEEWWDVCRKVRPDITREEYEAMWEENTQHKEERERRAKLH